MAAATIGLLAAGLVFWANGQSRPDRNAAQTVADAAVAHPTPRRACEVGRKRRFNNSPQRRSEFLGTPGQPTAAAGARCRSCLA